MQQWFVVVIGEGQLLCQMQSHYLITDPTVGEMVVKPSAVQLLHRHLNLSLHGLVID